MHVRGGRAAGSGWAPGPSWCGSTTSGTMLGWWPPPPARPPPSPHLTPRPSPPPLTSPMNTQSSSSRPCFFWNSRCSAATASTLSARDTCAAPGGGGQGEWAGWAAVGRVRCQPPPAVPSQRYASEPHYSAAAAGFSWQSSSRAGYRHAVSAQGARLGRATRIPPSPTQPSPGGDTVTGRAGQPSAATAHPPRGRGCGPRGRAPPCPRWRTGS